VLTTTLLHPQLLEALATAGHGSRVLIADGNYPFGTRANPRATRVYLNLVPGVLDAPTVLAAVLAAVPVEAAHAMGPDDGSEPSIYADFRALLPAAVEVVRMDRHAFYDAARDDDVALVIATAERRLFANILITLGVRPEDA
jgi:L-fucose mutarotase